VTMRLSSTVIEIWPFEVLPERFFQEQRSVVGRLSVGRSVGSQQAFLRYVRNIARGVKSMCEKCLSYKTFGVHQDFH